jgi:hypothetical protein
MKKKSVPAVAVWTANVVQIAPANAIVSRNANVFRKTTVGSKQ